MNKSKIKFELAVSIIKEGKQYVAYSPALDLSTCGKTQNRARKRFKEAIDIFFEELVKKETLEKVLANLGWEKKNSQWKSPAIVLIDTRTFCLAS